jgi:hypothetical protein
MKRTISLTTAIAAIAVPAAVAASGVTISAYGIGGARPGGSEAAYARFLGSDAQREATVRTNPAFSRLFSRTRRAAVYFKKQTQKAVVVVTWNKSDRNAAGFGPCSPIAQLKKAYGSKLKPVKSETYASGAYAYSLGHLIFGAHGHGGHPSTHVTAVGLYADTSEPTATNFTIAIDEAVC